MQNEVLTFENHSRYFKECKYVYPVVSRRSQGISLGINLNLNNACNWRCIYCQVDGLIRGKPDSIDRDILAHELDTMLNWIVNGDFIANFAPEGLQRFNDICLAGNGEPTLSPDFLFTCDLIANLQDKYKLKDVKTVLITNGSQFYSSVVQNAVQIIAACNGEVWFKVDRISKDSVNCVNQINMSIDSVSERLKISSNLCKTYIQSCWFNNNNKEPDIADVDEFIDFVAIHKDYIHGVLLYSTARNPALIEGANITQSSNEFLSNINERLLKLGISSVFYR